MKATKTIKRTLAGLAAGGALLGAGAALAVGDSPGGPRVDELNLQSPVTDVARQLYDLNTMMLILCAIIFVGVFSVMFYSVFAHRKSKGHKAALFHESTVVEVIWTIVPFVIVVLMALPATRAVIEMKDTSNADLTIKVTGYQWKWGYDYLQGPGQGISFLSTLTTPRSEIDGAVPPSNTYIQEVDHPLVVPVDRKIRIITTAADVVHSWYVPAFGVKQDAIPGYLRETWFKATKIGEYRGFCTELCGKEHAYMPVVVDVVSGDDYAKWVARQLAAGTAARAASAVAQAGAPAAASPAVAVASAGAAGTAAAAWPAEVYFDTGASRLPAAAQAVTAEVAAYAQAHPQAVFDVSGFTDASGAASLNADLSRRRAFAVRDALRAAGVAESRIVLKKPQTVTGGGSAGSARRVEISLAQ